MHEHVAAPHVFARPVEEAPPRDYARPAVHERNAAPRYIAPRYVAPHYIAPHYVAPHHAVVRAPRSTFVRYYPRTYVQAPVIHRRVVFHRYVPQRIFVARPVQVVRTYSVAPAYAGTASIPVSYVYSGYVPVYGSYPVTTPTYYGTPLMPLPLPIAFTPPVYDYGYNYGYNDTNAYNYDPYANGQYAYSQYPYGGQYPGPYGAYGGQYGMAPFGNAQLQGVVIASTGNGILVMTPSMKPVFVNTSIAQQNGYVNGNIQTGSFVNVFGYDTGNEFIATAIG
jgi:hypothetical protein